MPPRWARRSRKRAAPARTATTVSAHRNKIARVNETSPIAEKPVSSTVRVRVWDLPTRVTHWTFVVVFGVLWWTAETGRMEWHRWAGYTLLALLLFRVYWGFLGSSTARFSRFIRGPRAVGQYLQGNWITAAGHN